MKQGDYVIERNHKSEGLVNQVYDNWEDLKSKNDFLTIDPSNESDDMSTVDKLVSGDPKDEWLNEQEIPFTKQQLQEKWYSVYTLDGGEIWACESNLKLDNNI